MKVEDYHRVEMDGNTEELLEALTGTAELDERLVRTYWTYKALRDSWRDPLRPVEWKYLCVMFGIYKNADSEMSDPDISHYASLLADKKNGSIPKEFLTDAFMETVLEQALHGVGNPSSRAYEYLAVKHDIVAVPDFVKPRLMDSKKRHDDIVESRERAEENRRKAVSEFDGSVATSDELNVESLKGKDIVIEHYGPKCGRVVGRDDNGKVVFECSDNGRSYRLRTIKLHEQAAQ